MKRKTRQRVRFTALLVEHGTYIRALARKLSKGDRDLFDDFVQEALFALWRMDPDKARWASDPRFAERGQIRNAMRKFRRSQSFGGVVMERL